MRKVQDDLDHLPQSFSDNPQAKLLSLCTDFISEIDQHTNGSPNNPGFFQDLHGEFWKLRKKIMSTRLGFEITPGNTEPKSTGIVAPQFVEAYPATPIIPVSYIALPAVSTEESTKVDRPESNGNGAQPREGKNLSIMAFNI